MLRGGCEHRGLPELAALQVPKKRHEKRYRRRETGGTCRAATRDRAGKGGGDGRCAYCEKKEMYRFTLSPRLRKRPDSKKEIAKLLIQVLTYLYSSDDVFAKNGKSGLTKI
jgi:hypothetical protein